MSMEGTNLVLSYIKEAFKIGSIFIKTRAPLPFLPFLYLSINHVEIILKYANLILNNLDLELNKANIKQKRLKEPNL